jgi:hypothetical protein
MYYYYFWMMLLLKLGSVVVDDDAISPLELELLRESNPSSQL